MTENDLWRLENWTEVVTRLQELSVQVFDITNRHDAMSNPKWMRCSDEEINTFFDLHQELYTAKKEYQERVSNIVNAAIDRLVATKRELLEKINEQKKEDGSN